jgi:hypothetical protein
MANDESMTPAINKLAEEIKRHEDAANDLKRTVNKLCEFAGRGPMYVISDTQKLNLGAMRRDQFFGVAMATAVKQFLDMRGDPKTGGMGAATVGEIFEALQQGGFDFQTRNEDNAKRGLRASLSKNTRDFTRVAGQGDAAYGLREWYPAVKDTKIKSASEFSSDAENEDSEETLSEGKADGDSPI